MTELTDTERARGHVGIPTTRGRWYSEAQVEAILTAREELLYDDLRDDLSAAIRTRDEWEVNAEDAEARLTRVEALADEWEATPDAVLGMSQHYAADALRAAIAALTPTEVQP